MYPSKVGKADIISYGLSGSLLVPFYAVSENLLFYQDCLLCSVISRARIPIYFAA